MLSLEKVKSELGILGYPYVNHILCGHTKSKVKWISCQESWILLCEFPEDLIGIFTNDSIVEFAYGNNWKHGHFDEIRRVL